MTKAVRAALSASASALALSLATAPLPAQASYPGEPQCVFDPVAVTATCNDFVWYDTLTGNELAVDDLTLVVGNLASAVIDTVYEPGILANWGGDITLDIGGFAYVDSEYADAVRVVASGDFDATVVNDGRVVSRDSGLATGIYVRGQDDVSIQNHGLVAGVTYDGGEYSWGGEAVGIEVVVDGGETGGSVSILNDGIVYALEIDDSYYGNNYGAAAGIWVGTNEAGVVIDNGGVSGAGQIFAVGSDATGIEVNVRGSGAIAITNSGTVDVSAKYDAIGIEAYADESGVTIANAGLVDVSGSDASGIVAISFEGNAIFTNSGDVIVSGTSNAMGIGGVSVIGNVSITNTSAGDIEVAGDGYDRPVQGIVGYTISGYYAGGDVTIVNAGDVLVSADYAAQGVVANTHAKYYGGDSGDITVTNSGRITVSAYGQAEGIFASTGNGAINIANTSTGVIDVTSEYERAVGIEAENDGGEGAGTLADISIRNDGRITVSGQSYVAGIYADASIGNVGIVNTRTITASGVEAGVAGIYAAAHAGDLTVSNTSTGTITATSDSVYWDGGEYGYWIGGEAYGVIASAAGNITIDNAGLVDVTGEMSGTGIEASSNGGQITITNQALGHILVDTGMEDAVGIEADNSGYYYGPQALAFVQENGVPPGGVTITNNGIIAVESQDGSARGIDAFSVYGAVSVANGNTLTVYAADRGTGIEAYSVYGNVAVDNGGALVVMTSSDDADGIVAGSYYAGSVTVTSSGAVSVTSDQADAHAISAYSGGDVSVTNSGNILVSAGLSGGYWNEGFGIDAAAYYQGSVFVENSGDIDVTANFLGVGIDASSDLGDIEVVNNSTVTVSGGMLGTGVAAFSWDGDIGVYNYGDITVSGAYWDGIGIDVTNRPWFDATGFGPLQPSAGMGDMFVDNGGTIDVTAEGIAFGIRARSGGYYSFSGDIGIVNDGDINATSTDVSAFGIDTHIDGGESGGGNILIANYGSITTSAEQYSVGIRADARQGWGYGYGSGGGVEVFNDGDITVTADGGEGGGSATGIETHADHLVDGGEGGGLPQVFNSGSIVVHGAGDATGIDALTKYGASTPLVVNDGDITVTSDGAGFGIDAEVKYGDLVIDNSGQISVTAGDWAAVGIHADKSYYGDMYVTNSGSITATLAMGETFDGEILGWAEGIEAVGYGGDVFVASDGSITATAFDARAAIGILADASYGYNYSDGSAYVVLGDDATVRATATSAVGNTEAVGIVADGYYGEVTIGNRATVIATTTATGVEANADADGVFVYAEYAEVAVGAGSTVRATASALRGYAGATAINVEAYDAEVTVNANSIIEATATADFEAYAVGVEISSYGDVFAGNAGTIRATAAADVAYAAALYLSSEDGSITIANGGTLQATATGADGAVAAVYLNGNTVNSLTNTGIITGTGAGGLEGFSFVSVGDAVDVITNSGTMTGSIDTGVNDDVLWNKATGVINLNNQGIDLGAWGAVVPPPDGMGKLQSAPTPDITGNQFVNDGLIVVRGDGVIDMGTGNPNPFVHAGDINFQDGAPDDTLTVFGDVSGTGRLFIDINGAAATTDTLYVEGNVRSGTQFTVNGVLSSLPTTATTPINVMVVSGNSGSANLKLGSISMAPGSFVDVGFAVTEQLNAANTADDLHRLTLDITGLSDRGMALASLTPALQNYWHDSLGTFTRRMGVAEGQELGVPTLWLRAFRSEGEVDTSASGRNFGDANAVAFDQTDNGIELGLDVRLGSQVRIGLTASQGDISADLAGNAGGVEADVDSVGGYFTWLSPSGFYLDATYRQMEFETKVSAEGYLDRPDAEADGWSLEVGYAWKLDNELVLKPELQYSQMTVDKLDSITNSYGEFSLLNGDSSRLRAGLSINKTFGTKQNSWTPYAGLFYVDEMDGQGTFDVNGDFQGDSDIGGSSIVVEGGVTGQFGKWVLSGGLYWQDGDALKGIFGGQIAVRYAF